MCSFHGLARNVYTVLCTFPASGRSRSPTVYRKDSSLRQYLTASIGQRCAVAPYSHLSPEIVAFLREFTFGFQLKYISWFPLLLMIGQQIPSKLLNTLQHEKFPNQKFQWKLWKLCIVCIFCFCIYRILANEK